MILTHGAGTPGPGAWDAATLLVAAASFLAYLSGVRRLRRPRATRPFPRWRAAAFAGGLAVLVVSVSSPAEHLAEELFAAHMAQHLALAFVAAPLLVLGRPVLVLSVVLGHRAARGTRPARRLAHWLRSTPGGVPLAAAAHVVPWFVWHTPAAYQAALRSEAVHLLEHATLLGSGAALAWLAAGRAPLVPALAAVVAGMLAMGLVAAVLAFAGVPFYGGHVAPSWGLTVLEDQQLGGALMWFPGSLAYLTAAGVLVSRAARAPRPGRGAPAAAMQQAAPAP